METDQTTMSPVQMSQRQIITIVIMWVLRSGQRETRATRGHLAMAWAVAAMEQDVAVSAGECLAVAVEWECETWTLLPALAGQITRPSLEQVLTLSLPMIQEVTRATGEAEAEDSGVGEDSVEAARMTMADTIAITRIGTW